MYRRGDNQGSLGNFIEGEGNNRQFEEDEKYGRQYYNEYEDPGLFRPARNIIVLKSFFSQPWSVALMRLETYWAMKAGHGRNLLMRLSVAITTPKRQQLC